jgi:hypothetical protein
MPVANRDSSELTRGRRAMALYSFANTLRNQNGNSVRREQPNTQVLNVFTEARQGGCYCSNLSAGTYIFGGKIEGGSCGCSSGT